MPRRDPSARPPSDGDVEGYPLTFDHEKGRILFQGVPIWFVSAHYYVGLKRELEAVVGKAAKGILYRAAEQAGRWAAGRFSQTLTKNADDMARVTILLRMAETLPMMGHGKTNLVIGDLSALETTWTFPFSQIAAEHGPSEESVCDYYAGVVAGFVSALFDREALGSEVACRAKGDASCVVKTRVA